MVRRLVAGLVVVGLAIGVWALWPRGEPEPPPTTTVNAVDSTPPTTPATLITTTTVERDVVTTVEEAEEILRQLWFGWFEGIYNQDEDRIKEVVGNDSQLAAAVDQFGGIEFARAPAAADIALREVEILRSDAMCLAVWAHLDVSGSNTASTDGVHVFRYLDEHWLFVSLWVHRNDLWDADCDAQLLP